MKDFTSLISSLERVGLNSTARSIRSIESLYKISTTDFSKETEVLEKLINIVEAFRETSLDTISPARLSLPPYSIETHNKYIVYSGDDLSNYSKKEIFSVGLPNFLTSFIDKFMTSKLASLSGTDARRYEKAIEELRELSREIGTTYRKIAKPISPAQLLSPKFKPITQQDVASHLRRLNSIFANMNDFRVQIEQKYVPALGRSIGYTIEEGNIIKQDDEDDGEIEDIEDDDEGEDLPISNKERTEEEAEPTKEDEDAAIQELINKFPPFKSAALQEFYPKGTEEQMIKDLLNLSYNFQAIRDRIDQKYAKKLNMPIDQFREFTGIDSLLHIQRRADNNKPLDLLKELKQKTEHYETGRELIREEDARRTAKDVVNGKIGFTKKEKVPGDKKRTRVVFVLYSPKQIKYAWDYLQKELVIKYDAFVRSITDLAQTQKRMEQEHTPTSEEDKRKFINREMKKREALSVEVDSRIHKNLLNILRMLK